MLFCTVDGYIQIYDSKDITLYSITYRDITLHFSCSDVGRVEIIIFTYSGSKAHSGPAPNFRVNSTH